MNCRTFRKRSIETWPDDDRRALAPELEAHRRGCRRCAAAWSAERELRQQLVRLRQRAVQVDVRERVLRRLREQPPPDAALRPAVNAIAIATVAAAAILIGLVMVWAFPAPQLAGAWRLAVEQAPEWLAWGLQRLVRTVLSLAALAGGMLLNGALLLPTLYRWMRQLESALPDLILVNGLMALLLAAGLTTLLRCLPAPRRLW